jgi:MobA/MobL family
MAIPFISVGFWKFRDERGACAITAYIGRNIVLARSGTRYDFRRFRGDLVYENVVMPRGFAGPSPSRAQFARMIDAAETSRAKTRRKLRQRKLRERQLLFTMVVALPPDGECTLDEAIELCHAVVDRVVVDHSLIAHVAIHDPAVKLKGSRSRNRHAHIHIALRSWTPEATLSRLKVRDLVARVRHYKGSKGNFDAVAEGINWPDLSRELQTRLFTECSRNVLVDPIALIPQKHFGKLTWHYAEDAVKQHLAEIYQNNRSALAAPPKDLIAAMLRGRSSLPRAELRILVDRYIGSEQERRDLMEWIAADEMIVNLSPTDGQITRMTTRDVFDRFTRVRGLIEYIADRSDGTASGLHTAIGSHAVVINDRIANVCRDAALRRRYPMEGCITIVGQVLSHCDPIHKRLGSEHKNVRATTLADVGALSASWNEATTVILPRGESLADCDLATIIVSATAANAQLVLGYDATKGDGVVERRLATWIVERLTPDAVFAEIAGTSETNLVGNKLLRAGFVRSAISHLASQQSGDPLNWPQLVFSGQCLIAVASPGGTGRQSPHFIVVDDPRAIPAITQAERETANGIGELVPLKTPHGKVLSAVGEWIAFEKTDYTSQPARLREGRTARILSIDAENNTLMVEHDHGAAESIDLNRFPFVRPAYALTIGEARQLSAGASLEFRVTQRGHIYAALLAVTRHKGPATIVFAPEVASTLAELITVAEGHLPAGLPWQLQPRRDMAAELNVELIKGVAGSESIDHAHQLLTMPAEAEPQVPSAARATLRSPAIRGATLLTPNHKQGFENLIRAVSPGAPDRSDTVAQLLNPTGGWGSLLGRIVEAMIEADSLKPGPKPHFAKIDSPAALDELVEELEPTPLELNRFRTDLVALTSPTLFPPANRLSKSVEKSTINSRERTETTVSQLKK